MRLLFLFFLLFFFTFHSFDDGHAVLGYFGRSLGHRRWSCRDCWRGGRNWRWCRRLFRYSFISDYCFICCCWFGVDSRNVCYFFDRLFNDGFLFGFLDFLGGQDHLLFVVSFGYKKGGKKNKTKEGNLVFELSSTHTVHVMYIGKNKEVGLIASAAFVCWRFNRHQQLVVVPTPHIEAIGSITFDAAAAAGAAT